MINPASSLYFDANAKNFMNYRNHELLRYSDERHVAKQPYEDQTPAGLDHLITYPILERVKRWLGYYLYPAKNAISRKETLAAVSKLSGFNGLNRVADVLSV